MSPRTLAELGARTDAIRERWERLLRLERVRTPLASPDTLVHLMPVTLGNILSALGSGAEPNVTLENARDVLVPACGCGRNPYAAYFVSGERAVVEEAIYIQMSLPAEHRSSDDLAAIIRAFRRLAASEIETFCSVCIQQAHDPTCRLYANTG